MTPYARGASLALHHLKLAGAFDKIMPEGATLSNEGDHFQWKTPGGHTMLMPFRNETLQGHQDRLGKDKARELLHGAVQRESAHLDKEVNDAQTAFFNQNPRLRNALVGGGLGGMLGGLAGAAIGGVSRHEGPGALIGGLGGAALGIGLSQIGKPSQRKGPETHDFTDHDPRDLPKAFYHLSPQERRHLDHMDSIEQYHEDAAWDRRHGRDDHDWYMGSGPRNWRATNWHLGQNYDSRWPSHY